MKVNWEAQLPQEIRSKWGELMQDIAANTLVDIDRCEGGSNRLLDMERILNDEDDANDSMGLECRPRERKIGTINNHKLPVKDEFF